MIPMVMCTKCCKLKRDSRGQRLDIREVQIHLGHRSLSSTQVYTHLREREVAEHTSEHLDTFFRLNEKSVDSNINVQIILGTEHEYDGGDIDKAEKRAAFYIPFQKFYLALPDLKENSRSNDLNSYWNHNYHL